MGDHNCGNKIAQSVSQSVSQSVFRLLKEKTIRIYEGIWPDIGNMPFFVAADGPV